ncbi:Uncharacterised protein [Vibrio cholerae]|nr:Uncharacterised protein [Vibrio cholerae]
MTIKNVLMGDVFSALAASYRRASEVLSEVVRIIKACGNVQKINPSVIPKPP